MNHPALFSIVARTALGCLLISATAAAQTPAAPATPPAPPSAPPVAPPPAPSPEQLSYWFGVQYGANLRSFGVGDSVVLEAVTRGMKEGMQGKKLTAPEQLQMQSYVRAAMMNMVKRNQDAGKEFLARNGKEKGVVTTASGLEYRIIAAGDRKAPVITPADEVTVQYRGKLLDGSEFDSSYSRGIPATFRVDGVIKGWQEALVLMKPGAKWQLFIPPELAYGFEQKPGIPAGSLLIFDVEMISANSGSAPGLGLGSAPNQPKPAKSQ
jgi:FKBP-type peptidyl-prolyl cis-trans isomerase FklB